MYTSSHAYIYIYISPQPCSRCWPAHRSLQTQCGVNLFILDSRRVLAPTRNVLGSDIKTHLKSRVCYRLLHRILNERGAMWDFVVNMPGILGLYI